MSLAGVNPHWAPDPKGFGVDQERWRHDQALYAYGEYAMFCLMWRIRDHQAGLVGRCPTCYLARGKVAETYGQAAQERCPDCFGTTFEGGYKALIVRPTIFDVTEDGEQDHTRGITITARGAIQTTSDFNIVNDDYFFRADGSRWQLQSADAPSYLVTGFYHQGFNRGTIGTLIDARREDESSVAYLIPPDADTLTARLDVSSFHYPLDFSDIEDIRGPLI